MKTVKIRVAVSVDPGGDWSASGCKGMKDQDAIEFSRETIGDQERTYWLTAEVEVPETLEVPTSVTVA
jgi:hypothetical protein